MSYQILSLDGGGVFGALTAVFIDKLLIKFPKLVENSDMITGTSIGATVGLLLAKEVPIKEIISIFPEASENVFRRGCLRFGLGLAGVKAFYSNQYLKNLVTKYFGDMKLGDLKKKVLIPAFKLDNNKTPRHWKAKFFHNFEGEDNDSQIKIVDALMSSMAAPAFFPVYNNMVDGSLVENNPSMCAVAQTQDVRAKIEPRPKLNDLRVFSLGRESGDRFVEGDNLDWGYIKWIKPMIHIALDRDSRVIHYQVEKLLGSKYYRISPDVAELGCQIDSWEGVPDLIKFAEKYDLTEAENWLTLNWNN